MFTIVKTPNARMLLTPAIEQYLLGHYQTSTMAGMAADLSVSPSKIGKWLSEMGISKRYLRDVKQPDSDTFFRHDVNIVTI